jgi:hypothetical protein
MILRYYCSTATPLKFAAPLCGFNDDRKSEKYNGRVASSSNMFIQILNKILHLFERSLGGQTQIHHAPIVPCTILQSASKYTPIGLHHKPSTLT